MAIDVATGIDWNRGRCSIVRVQQGILREHYPEPLHKRQRTLCRKFAIGEATAIARPTTRSLFTNK